MTRTASAATTEITAARMIGWALPVELKGPEDTALYVSDLSDKVVYLLLRASQSLAAAKAAGCPCHHGIGWEIQRPHPTYVHVSNG
eukprot:766384-Hanusia_phi.AAC.4